MTGFRERRSGENHSPEKNFQGNNFRGEFFQENNFRENNFQENNFLENKEFRILSAIGIILGDWAEPGFGGPGMSGDIL